MPKIWALQQDYLLEYETKIQNATPEEIKAANSIFGNQEPDSILSIDGDTATIKIHGRLSQKGPSPIARYFGFTGTGYLDIIEAIREISENTDIKYVTLNMNTPGGEVLGVDNVYQAIEALCKKKEKVTAVNQGLIASAGYWIASAADEIISESPVNLTGSIGVIITVIDWTEFDKKLGIREVVIVSRNAPEKYPDVSKRKGIEILQKEADSIERVFIGRIAAGRGVSIEHVEKNYGRGSVLVALDPGGPDALDAKMIDEVITSEETKVKTTTIQKSTLETIKTPANAGANKQEVKMPTLKEFLAENPTAKVEYDAALKEEYDAGVTAGKEEVNKIVTKVSPFLASDTYGKSIRDLAAKAIKGEFNPDALIAVVAMEDEKREKKKSETATTETTETGETPPGQTPQGGNANGEINTEADMQAELAKMKKGAA